MYLGFVYLPAAEVYRNVHESGSLQKRMLANRQVNFRLGNLNGCAHEPS